jgi:hypothetical protein
MDMEMAALVALVVVETVEETDSLLQMEQPIQAVVLVELIT